MSNNLLEQLQDTIRFINSSSSLKPRVGVTLGSGLSSFGANVEVDIAIPYSDIPHFMAPTVQGHPGQLILGHAGNQPIAVLQGRVHYYEGHSIQDVVYPTRVLAQLGIEKLVVTNAAGGLDPEMQPGDFMIIKDHINLTGTNPLIGKNFEDLGLRFPDMSEPYCMNLVASLDEILTRRNLRHSIGVYCGVTGPTYETAAEIRYLQKIGGHAVGMSTVSETIAARHMGLAVCGISCITNLATGLSPTRLTHEEVTQVGRQVESDFSSFLFEFIQGL